MARVEGDGCEYCDGCAQVGIIHNVPVGNLQQHEHREGSRFIVDYTDDGAEDARDWEWRSAKPVETRDE